MAERASCSSVIIVRIEIAFATEGNPMQTAPTVEYRKLALA